MKLVLVILASTAALAIILFIIGSMRPKSHVASITVKLAKPDSDVFAVISNVEAQPQWAPDIRSVERLPDNAGRPSFRENYGGFKATTVVSESSPPRKFVKDILPTGPFHGSWTWELAPEGGGTRLTITERGTVDHALMRALMMFNDNRSTMRKYAAALGKKLGTEVIEVTS